MKTIFLITLFVLPCIIFSQPYTSYFTGDVNDVTTTTQAGTCLMGGATEDDNAMKWFLQRSGGGDIIVLRVTGTNGYNSYLYSGLSITVNSVETLVIPSTAAANDAYVRTQIRNAEAIFIAGGNQADYVNFWKGTAVDSALNYLINIKKVPIGGTSAGMMVQGQNYYSALGSSITSAQALANPYNTNITLGSNNFLHNPFLKRTITDTHFDNPDRKGRLVTFLARLVVDSATPQLAIACDEYTAVCIDETGLAKVFGGFPTYDDNAYFISVNCSVPNNIPETCVANTKLTWTQNNAALKVYRIKGSASANNSFNLNTFNNATGGTWQYWYVNNGVLQIDSNNTITQPVCTPLAIKNNDDKLQYNTEKPVDEINFYPNPFVNTINCKLSKNITQVNVYNALGVLLYQSNYLFQEKNITIHLPKIKTEIVLIEAVCRNGKRVIKKMIQQ